MSYGLGPHVTYIPNNFVGDTVAVGGQAHVGFLVDPGWVQILNCMAITPPSSWRADALELA